MPGCYVEMKFKKFISKKCLNYNCGGVWTPDLRCSLIMYIPLSYSVSPDWNLNPYLFCSFIKDKPLSCSVNGDWYVVFWNISNTSLCEASISLCGRTSRKTQVNFDADASNQVIFDPHTQHKSILISTLKSSQFRSPLKNQANFDVTTPKPSYLGSQHKPIFLRPPHWNEFIF